MTQVYFNFLLYYFNENTNCRRTDLKRITNAVRNSMSSQHSSSHDLEESVQEPDVTNILLLRAGDVELNPGPKRKLSESADFGGISEDELSDLAEGLGNHPNLRKLALKLGFSNEKWQLHKASNTQRDGRGCTDGTFNMLCDWKMAIPKASQIPELNKALTAAGFAGLAEEYLPKVEGKEGKQSDAVPDEKLTILAEHVPHEKYSRAQGILYKHSNDSTIAMRECLGIWKHETGDSSAKLKEILSNAGIGEEDDAAAQADSKKQQILLEDGRIVVIIPPGETKDGGKVIVETISAGTADLPLKDNEVVISTGLRFLPSGTKFDKPVKVTMPHCAIFRKLDKAKIILYRRKIDGSKDVKTITSVANQIPRCDIREKDLDLYIDYFSDWWIISVIERVKNYFKGIRLLCTPHIPVSPRMDGQDRVYLYLRKDNGRTEEPLPECQLGGHWKQYFIKWRHGPVIISSLYGDTKFPEKKLEEEKFHYLTQDFVTFTLNLCEATGGRIAGEFFLKQSIETMIPFYLQLHGRNPVTPLGSTPSTSVGVLSSSLDVSSTDIPSTSHGSSGATASLPTRWPPQSSSQQQGCMDPVTDELLTRLSKKIPHNKYIEVCEKILPDDYNRVRNILRKNCNDYETAIRECLGMWKNRTGGSLAELGSILEAAELGGRRYLLTRLTSTEYERGFQRFPNISFSYAVLPPMVLLLYTIYSWYKSL